MPLYEYKCTDCKRHTEKIQKFSDPEITQCPYCGGKLERVISAPAVSFKGGGWYADGYGNAKPSATKSEASGSKSDSGGSSAPSSDAASSSGKDSATTSAAPAAPAPAAASSEKK